jgi:hypothetical protein
VQPQRLETTRACEEREGMAPLSMSSGLSVPALCQAEPYVFRGDVQTLPNELTTSQCAMCAWSGACIGKLRGTHE